ncbi:acyl-CoA synthetase [Marivibrio halodurans]|uniref:3-methylmercaptopropionyl-CoA ligase n=2 Tax=Marivibrio halodurans TaxID=2039722 RepID=A0A8J7S4H4_9PROT|nr:acyl-CoA synthetase [Marivibrio halodurans]MBP5855487.1 acyl-CoA synthetase [Marivibrio halodurans]
MYDRDLDRTPANFVPLSPISFLERAANLYPDRVAIIHGARRITYGEFLKRVRRFASALAKRGIGKGDTVSVMALNTPALLEAHYAVPMVGAVLNAINTRLDPATVAFILTHGEAKAVFTDRELNPIMGPALEQLDRKPDFVVDIDDAEAAEGEFVGEIEYEAFLEQGDPDHPITLPADEWDSLCLNYTSGTTGNPKGVVYHHRGAYLNALSNAMTFNLTRESVYLWTLPMFHCNGWTYTWAVTAACGTHVCLRKVDPAKIFPMIAEHGVTHMCGAPIVLTMLIHAPGEQKRTFPQRVEVATGGAAPPSAVISKMENMGFNVTHLYGMTECYGPATVCAWQDDWDDMELEARAARMARQGTNMVAVAGYRVADEESFEDVPRDGKTVGMLMLRSNTVMKGYLKNPEATREALRNGWLSTGDLAVMHPDGYVEIKDRAKDIIISGGENISSLEVEEVLYKHPDIVEAAVVAAPHEKWGETPVAYVTPKPEAVGRLTADAVIDYCKEHMARFKAPTRIVFGPLPKTSTGKIQKFVLREQAKETG